MAGGYWGSENKIISVVVYKKGAIWKEVKNEIVSSKRHRYKQLDRKSNVKGYPRGEMSLKWSLTGRGRGRGKWEKESEKE